MPAKPTPNAVKTKIVRSLKNFAPAIQDAVLEAVKRDLELERLGGALFAEKEPE